MEDPFVAALILLQTYLEIEYEGFCTTRRYVLPERVQSLWEYGHRSHSMIYCNDRALAEALGDRYVPEASDELYSILREDLHQLIHRLFP
jgi:hypothetical protein